MKSNQIGVFINKEISNDPIISQKSCTQISDKYLWFYKDPFGRVQGEFDGTQMLEWYKSGVYFTPQLQLRRKCDKNFSTLNYYIKLFGGIPFNSQIDLEPIQHTNENTQLNKNWNCNYSNDLQMLDDKRPLIHEAPTHISSELKEIDNHENILANHLASCFLEPKESLDKVYQSWPSSHQEYFIKKTALRKDEIYQKIPDNETLDYKIGQYKYESNNLVIPQCNEENRQIKSTLEKWYSKGHERLSSNATKNSQFTDNSDKSFSIGYYDAKSLNHRSNIQNINKDSISCSNSSSGVHSQSSDSSPRPELVTSFASSSIELNQKKPELISSQKSANTYSNSSKVNRVQPSSLPKKLALKSENTKQSNCLTDKNNKSVNKTDCELSNLINWSQDYLHGVEFKQNVDLPTIVELLATIDAPYEVENTFQLYLGESPRIVQFIKEFLDRRRPYWQKNNQANAEQKNSKSKSNKSKKNQNIPGSDYYTFEIVSKQDRIQNQKAKRGENQWQKISSKKPKSKTQNSNQTNQFNDMKANRSQMI